MKPLFVAPYGMTVIKPGVGYQHRPSTRSLREQAERDNLLMKRMVAEGNELDLLTIPYGGEPVSNDGKLLVAARMAYHQRRTICHTSRGDFSHLHANRVIIK